MQINKNSVILNKSKVNKYAYSPNFGAKIPVELAQEAAERALKTSSSSITASAIGGLALTAGILPLLNLPQKESKNSLTPDMVNSINKQGKYIPKSIRPVVERAVNLFAMDNHLDVDFKQSMIEKILMFASVGIKTENMDELSFKVIDLYKKVAERPDLYSNKDNYTPQEFFNLNLERLFEAFDIVDKSTVEAILRRRYDFARDYLEQIQNLPSQHKEFIKNIIKSKQEEGNPLNPKQELELINLFSAYQSARINITEDMIKDENGKYDIKNLQMILLRNFIKKAGLSDEEIASLPPEKFEGWDFEYLPLLEKSMNYEGYLFKELIRVELLHNVDEYLHDPQTRHGVVNLRTREQYLGRNMDYQKWVKTDKNLEKTILIKSDTQRAIEEVSVKITKDIEKLRKTKAKMFIDKQLGQYIVNDKFVIPAEKMKNKQTFERFVKGIIKQLDGVWKRAEISIDKNIVENIQVAKKTLKTKKSLESGFEKISKLPKEKAPKPLKLTIKTWDRQPKKDTFQGNKTGCCVGVGRPQATAIATYVLNTAFNMLEILNENGDVVVNALYYMADDKNGKPVMIIDNIEKAGSLELSETAEKELLEEIVNYAHSVAKDVTGNPEVEVYLGSSINDISSEYDNEDKEISFIGDISEDFIYLDAYDSSVVEKHNLKDTCWLQRLR